MERKKERENLEEIERMKENQEYKIHGETQKVGSKEENKIRKRTKLKLIRKGGNRRKYEKWQKKEER